MCGYNDTINPYTKQADMVINNIVLFLVIIKA